MQKVGVPLLVLLAAAVGPGRAQESAPQAPGPTIRVTTTEVTLDLVVRDKKGRQVKNLKPGDVEIYEDGVRQQILSFRSVSGREARRDVETQAKAQPPAVSRMLPEVNTLCIVFHNIDPVTRPHAINVVKEFIRNDMPPETYIGVFVLNERLIPLRAFTKNRDELLQSLTGLFEGKPLDFGRASEALLTASPNIVTINAQVDNATHTASVSVDTNGGEISKTVIVGADTSTGAGANRLRGDQVRERSDFANITGMHETDRIITMIDQVSPLPGRKTILLVTTGLVTTGDPERFQKILNNANSHGVTVYALDSTEMNAMDDTAQAGKLAVAQMAQVSQQQSDLNASLSVMRQNSRQGDDTISAVRTSDLQSSLRALSEGTGGFLIANTNDFRKPFQQLVENLDTHYVAAYHPTSTVYDGRLRKIEVKLARNDLRVESRTGYFALPELKGWDSLTPTESTGLAVLNTEPRPHSFEFHVTAYHFRAAGTSAHGTLAFDLPGTKLGATIDPVSRIRKLEVSLLALIRDSHGNVVDKYSNDTPYFIPDANWAAVRANDLTYTHPIDLLPGHYTVETAVVDREGSQASAETSQIDIPARSKGVGISSLVVVQQVESANAQADADDPLTFKGKHVVPLVDAVVNPATKRYVYFVVYPDKSNPQKPRIHVQFKAGGEVFAERTVDLPAPDATGTIPMFVAAATRPGNCELQITALQGNESATEHLQYAVRAQ
ncbi:MAG TPA: VWA domain-containing protein [Bryobacteraceae bacterium]|nr:VWA domain-containing protein [Bryobacteraceae bacterium]